ncbi:retrovirus-related pol polyprotein from transposon TNT 1-94, partial [Tanacetum coccineum]
MKIEESLNVTFDEIPPPLKTSPLVDDDLDEEELIKVTEKKNFENDEIVNIKEFRNHPLENVIGNLNQRTLRLESIRILLAYACAFDFKLFQMDVKNAFLNGFINEEVYVAQPPGFIDFEKPDHVYKLKKALYGLKQAPKAWYDRLKAFLIKHEYKIGMVDTTLFTKKKSLNLIIVQIYVDDIIFGLTCQDMCDEFAKIMHDKFEMSMMGELNFFLGLQIKQMEDEVLTVMEEEGNTWMTPIYKYLTEETLNAEKKKARKVRLKSRWFGLPGEIISDNGKQFRDNPFKDWCEKLNIRQRFASVKHPQANGLVEKANRSLGEGMKARLDKGSKDWMEEIPHVLWAHRTVIKSSNEDTPFSLTYGTEAVIPAKIGMPTLRTIEIDM